MWLGRKQKRPANVVRWQGSGDGRRAARRAWSACSGAERQHRLVGERCGNRVRSKEPQCLRRQRRNNRLLHERLQPGDDAALDMIASTRFVSSADAAARWSSLRGMWQRVVAMLMYSRMPLMQALDQAEYVDGKHQRSQKAKLHDFAHVQHHRQCATETATFNRFSVTNLSARVRCSDACVKLCIYDHCNIFPKSEYCFVFRTAGDECTDGCICVGCRQ